MKVKFLRLKELINTISKNFSNLKEIEMAVITNFGVLLTTDPINHLCPKLQYPSWLGIISQRVGAQVAMVEHKPPHK